MMDDRASKVPEPTDGELIYREVDKAFKESKRHWEDQSRTEIVTEAMKQTKKFFNIRTA